MSKLFFKVSWQHNIDRYRDLQKQAKRQGLSLRVRNVSRTRGIPVFLFFISEPGNDIDQSFHDLDGVAAWLHKRAIHRIDAADAALLALRDGGDA